MWDNFLHLCFILRDGVEVCFDILYEVLKKDTGEIRLYQKSIIFLLKGKERQRVRPARAAFSQTQNNIPGNGKVANFLSYQYVHRYDLNPFLKPN